MKTNLINSVELLKSKFIRVNKLEWYMFNKHTDNYERVTGNMATFIENLYTKEANIDYKSDKYA